MLKIALGILVGIMGTLMLLVALEIFSPSQEPSGIFINIENDISDTVKQVSIVSHHGQVFTCTMLYKKCVVSIYNSGDTSFKIRVILDSGTVLKGSIGYAEPSSKHYVAVSKLVPEDA